MANPSLRVRRSSHCFRTTSCRKNKRRPPQIVGCSSSLLEEGDVLTVEDAERLLQRLDLLLAARNAVLVRHTGIHARRLELVVVRQCRVELLLRRWSYNHVGAGMRHGETLHRQRTINMQLKPGRHTT